MRVLPGVVLTALVVTTLSSAPADAVAPDLTITKVARTKLDDGTCMLSVKFEDSSPESVDGNDFYRLVTKPAPTGDWFGQSYSDHITIGPCTVFKKGKTYRFVVEEWDDDGARQEVVAKSPAITWKRK